GNQYQGEPGCNHQVGGLDDKACTLFSFASFASLAVQMLDLGYSARMPASLTSLPKRARSVLISAENSSGVPPMRSRPRAVSLSYTSGMLRVRVISACSL